MCANLGFPDPNLLRKLKGIARDIRAQTLDILRGLGEEHRGHPGASLSITDIVTALYFHVLVIDPANPHWEHRDRFILSKGHGCLPVYVALAKLGFFDPGHLSQFRFVDSPLQGHPDMTRTPGVDMTSGSLGNGLSAGVGIALATRDVKERRVFVYIVLGDGELQEGIIWEAAMAATKYRLNNLIAIADCNRFQSCGPVDEIMPLTPLARKWRSFGWNVIEIDGHDMSQILRAISKARGARRKPSIILARTIKGKGVPYMEDDNRWHQRCPISLPGTGSPGRTEAPARAVKRLISTRTAFGEALLELARERRDIVALSADTSASLGMDILSREFPDRCVEVGIAEQNMMMIAAGMAATGKTVFAGSYSVFSSMRGCEQIRTFIAYPRLNVKIVGALGGFSGGIEGTTHVAAEDIGIMRCIPNMVILNPADALATAKAVYAAANHRGPVYIRIGRDPSPVIFDDRYRFTIGKAVTLVEDGCDAVLMTSGLITSEVLRASALLRRTGIRCSVLEFPTLKPLDDERVIRAAEKSGAIFVIEEHNIIGGLGSAVMEVLGESYPHQVRRMGVPDCFVESGAPEELRKKFGLTAAQIAGRIRSALRNGGWSSLIREKWGDKSVDIPEGKRDGGENPCVEKRHEREPGQDNR